MAESSWPMPTYNSGAVSNSEYESLHANEGAGMIGQYTESAAIFADSSGRQIKIRASRFAYIRGYTWYSGTGDVTVAIAANSSGSTRIDRVVLRLTRSDWSVRVAVIAGTPGAGAPAWTQNTGTTGVFEISLALVTVANGASTLNAADVVFHAMYYAPRVMIGNTNAVPWAMHANFTQYAGMMWTDATSTQVYVHDTSDAEVLVRNSDSGLTNGSGAIATGFTTAGNGIRYQLKNGQVWLQFDLQRTGANLATGTSTTIMTLPAGHRPALGFFFAVTLVSTTGNTARCYVNTTGVVTLDSLDGALNTSGYVCGAITFPAA